jgi:hypothetical protein
MKSTKGVHFVNRNKVEVNVKRHADIMEDALDRITIKEAIQNTEFVAWDEVEKKINKKLGVHYGIHNKTNKTSRKSNIKSK